MEKKIKFHIGIYKPIILLLCSICIVSEILAQQLTIKGTVTDDENKPLAGASVKILNTNTIGTTDDNGSYKIIATKGQTIEISFIGKESVRLPIGDGLTYNATLKDMKASDLNEVVVTGYMSQKKADLTGAVAVISTQDLAKNHGGTNIMQALQGVAPGLHITTDGSPSGNVGIQVRGLTSLNGSNPLIVIDGMPSYINLRDLNPDNIASLQILKDAYSASIYGTQGGAGVILIQTKKGQAGKTKLSYNGTIGFADFHNKPQMLNTQQYGQALWQAAVNDGQEPNAVTQIYNYDWHKDANDIPILDKINTRKYLNADSTMLAANTNWLDAISQRGLQNNHQLTLSGGSEKSTSFLSLNFMQNQGTQIYTSFTRYSLRANNEFKVLKDHLTIGQNLEILHMIDNNQNVMHDALVEPPIIPVHTTDGGWGGSAVALGMDDYWNPVRELTLNKNNGNTYNKVIGDIHASAMFLDHFTLRSQFSLMYSDGYHRTIQFTFQEGGGKFNPISSVDQWYWKEATLDWSNTLNYKLSKGKHNLDALVGMEANKYTTETMDGNRQTLAFQNYDYAYLSTATGNMSVSGGGDRYNLLSYFGKFNYSYNSRYLLSGSLRYDGSSKFGTNDRFALFPAISAGWRISSESFLSDSKIISDLKLRASWGRNGSLASISSLTSKTFFGSSYNFTSYGISGNETGNLPSGYYKVQTGNPDLKWETTDQANIGLDFGLFEQRLTGSLDFYRKKTNGMLIQPPYLGTFGEGAAQYINAANMTNKGLELSVGYQSRLGTTIGYQIRGNIAYNKNAVNSLPSSVLYSWGGSALKGDAINGHAWGSYYGFVADGLFKTQVDLTNSADQPGKGLGRIRYKDLSGPDGKPDGKIDYDYDRTWISDGPTPKIEYGMSFSFNYKNFDFSMFWQGIAAVKAYNSWKSYSDFWNVWVQNGFNHPTRVLDAWSLSNPNSTIPALSLNNVNDELRTSTYFIEPGWYLKMRNIQIGYSLPKNLTSRIGMEKCYFFVMAENLIMIKSKQYTGPDPENPDGSSYSNPYVRPRVFKTGLQVSF